MVNALSLCADSCNTMHRASIGQGNVSKQITQSTVQQSGSDSNHAIMSIRGKCNFKKPENFIQANLCISQVLIIIFLFQIKGFVFFSCLLQCLFLAILLPFLFVLFKSDKAFPEKISDQTKKKTHKDLQ